MRCRERKWDATACQSLYNIQNLFSIVYPRAGPSGQSEARKTLVGVRASGVMQFQTLKPLLRRERGGPAAGTRGLGGGFGLSLLLRPEPGDWAAASA